MIIDDIRIDTDLSKILVDIQSASYERTGRLLFAKGFKDSGNDIMMQCPYHSDGQERKPSAGIHKETGMLHCFACGAVHTFPEFISHCFGYEDGGLFGWKWLLKNYVSVSREDRKDVELDFRRNIYRADSNRLDKQFVTEEELDKYRYTHPYILKRGVSEKIVELFDIGWDSKTDCITFPNLDKYGNCLFVAKRSVKQKFFQYPKNVQKELYGIYQLYQLNPFPSEIYVCESMIDCLYLWTFDIPACAMNGLGNEVQFKQLRELPCRQLILATDADEAGQAARKRIRMNMQNMKIIKEVVLPKGRKDINDCSAVEIQNLVTIF